MDVMRDKDTLLQVRNKNHQVLLEELDTIVSRMDLDDKHTKALLDGDLTKQEGIKMCTKAAQALHQAMSVDLHSCKCNFTTIFTRIQASLLFFLRDFSGGGSI